MDEYSAYTLLVEGTEINEKKTNEKPAKKHVNKEKKIKNFRLLHKINCKSTNTRIPDPIKTFQELISRYKMPKDFLKCFGSLEYTTPTAVQMQSIPVMIEKHNLFTIAPTGSGKTAAFLIPIINYIIDIKSKDMNVDENSDICCPKAIILSPTIELAKQIFQESLCLIKELEMEFKPKVAIFVKGKSLNKHADIVICTPLRLKNTLIKTEKEIQLNKLGWLVIDESDQMLRDSIFSFSDQFKVIFEKSKQSPDCRVAMFSATQTRTIVEWVKNNLTTDLIYVRIGVKDAAVETVSQELRYCYSEEIKFEELKCLLSSGKLQIPCLIFLDQGKNASYLYELIKNHGARANITVGSISGKCSDSMRRDVISDFREGKIHFLICSNLLARGIDFKGVSTVVNYDLPKHKEEYIHRIGRCGRAGNVGRAVSFWTDEDTVNGLPAVLSVMKASNQPVNDELHELIKSRVKEIRYKGDRIMEKLKRKYKSSNEEGKEESCKKMRFSDKKKKLYVENCVVRKKFLERKVNLFKE